MQKFSTVLNIVLLIAVAVLYYLWFSNRSTSVAATPVGKDSSGVSKLHIAYFDLDTLQKHYDYFIEMSKYIDGKRGTMEQKLNGLRNQITAKINDYNKRGPGLSQTEQLQLQEEVGNMQNNYQQQEQNLTQEFQSESMEKMLDIKARIQLLLKKYSADKGYTYVFATSSDDNVIYYRDSVNDVTSELVTLLNEDYNAGKKK